MPVNTDTFQRPAAEGADYLLPLSLRQIPRWTIALEGWSLESAHLT